MSKSLTILSNYYPNFSFLFNIQSLLLVFLFLTTSFAVGQAPKKYLALGDSYTIGESVNEHDRWPNQLAVQLSKRGNLVESPTIIATTGWRTDDLKNAIVKANLKPDYDLVSLLIGVNNQYQGKLASQYEREFQELLTIALQLAKGKKENVFVVSIPDYGYTPFGLPKQVAISKAIDEFNAINKKVADSAGIYYFNITDISRKGLLQPDLVAGDGLHPSGKQYALWTDLIAHTLAK